MTLGLVYREAVVVGGGQAGRLADGAVGVGEAHRRTGTGRGGGCPHPSLEHAGPPERLDAARSPPRGAPMQALVHGLEGDVAHAQRTPDAIASTTR